MKCPYCKIKQNKLAINGPLTSPAPFLCDNCLHIGLFENGIIREVTEEELGWIKESPAYKSFILPVLKELEKKRAVN